MKKLTILFPAFILTITVAFHTACSSSLLKPFQSKSALNLEAAIVYKMGGVQPIARQEFYLLDRDLNEIFKEQGEVQAKSLGGVARKRYYELNDLVYPVVNRNEFASLTNDVIPKYVKYRIQTDFQGKAQLKDINPGRYYLYGNSETRGGRAVWNLQVDLKTGENSIVLDQNNAAKAN